jgi:hypothetical protein
LEYVKPLNPNKEPDSSSGAVLVIESPRAYKKSCIPNTFDDMANLIKKVAKVTFVLGAIGMCAFDIYYEASSGTWHKHSIAQNIGDTALILVSGAVGGVASALIGSILTFCGVSMASGCGECFCGKDPQGESFV